MKRVQYRMIDGEHAVIWLDEKGNEHCAHKGDSVKIVRHYHGHEDVICGKIVNIYEDNCMTIDRGTLIMCYFHMITNMELIETGE